MHAHYPSPLEHLLNYVSPEPNSGCWLWFGPVNNQGYGDIGFYDEAAGKSIRRLAHRLSYELHEGPIPKGLELDHKCRVACCVNPKHLEPVTHQENCRRGTCGSINAARNLAKTHCPHGHEFTESNTMIRKNGWRRCRACQIKRLAIRRARLRSGL